MDWTVWTGLWTGLCGLDSVYCNYIMSKIDTGLYDVILNDVIVKCMGTYCCRVCIAETTNIVWTVSIYLYTCMPGLSIQ